MISFFKKSNQIYPELNPTERIPRIIQEFIFPPLEKEGFKILNSGLSIKRNTNIFTQEIWFSRSKWNIENEICAFTPHFSTTIKGYNRWHKSKYGDNPLNDVLYGRAANYIQGWNKELFDGNDYDLAKNDNKRIIQLLNENIKLAGLSHLLELSNYKTAIDFLRDSKHYYLTPKMIDICFIAKDFKMARGVLKWFREYEQTGESNFSDSTIKDIELRVKELNGA